MQASGSYTETESLQNAGDIDLADVLSENAFHFAAVQFELGTLDLPANRINEIAFDVPPGCFHNELSDTISCSGCNAVVCAALEAVRGVCVHAEPSCRAAHSCRIKPSGLDEHVLRLLGDHRVEAAHDAGDSDGLYRIGDHKILRGQLSFDAVERLQRFLFASEPHHDL